MSKALDALFTKLPPRLGIDELTDLFGLSDRTITYKWLRDGHVPAIKVGGTWIILRDDVKEHLESKYNVKPGVIGTPPPDDKDLTAPAIPASDVRDEDQALLPVPAAEDPQESKTSPSKSRNENQLIRAWAQDNGHNPSARGRLSQSIVDAYNSAHE